MLGFATNWAYAGAHNRVVGCMLFAEGNGALDRNHNSYGFTMWLARGGVRGGLWYRETDEFWFEAVVEKVHLRDLHATLLALPGLDHERLTCLHQRRVERFTDMFG